MQIKNKAKAITLRRKLKSFNSFAYLIKKRSFSWVIAALILFVFTTQTVFAAAPLPLPQAMVSAQTVTIPSDFGTVESVYTSPDTASKAPLILHIQDAHAYPEAQKSIYQILLHLSQNKNIGIVALEAAFGELKTEILNLSPVPQANQAVAEHLAGMGELTGAELFALDPMSRGVQIQGVEDLDLYKKSHEIFREIKSSRKQIRPLLQAYERVIEEAEIKKLNPELSAYIKARKMWENHSDESLEYFSILNRLAGTHLDLKFSDMAQQFQWPNIVRLLAVKDAENSFKAEVLQEEMEALNKSLKEKLETSKIRDFILEGLSQATDAKSSHSIDIWVASQTHQPEVKTVRHFFEVLQRESRKAGISLLRFPQFLIYGRLQILQQEIDTNGLFKETARLEPLIEKKLIKTKTEQKLLQIRRDLTLLKNLFNLKLTRKDHALYLKNKGSLEPAAFLKRVKEIGGDTKLSLFPEKLMLQAAEFYSLSLKRDEKLMEKTFEIARGSAKPVVLITGGFHNDGISEILRSRQISHMTVSPKMHSFVEQNLYEKIMAGEDSDPAYFLKTQNLGALFLLQPRQVYTDVFGDNAQFNERQRAAILGSWVSAGSQALQEQGWSLDQIEAMLEQAIRDHSDIFGDALITQANDRLQLILAGQPNEFAFMRSESRDNFSPNVRDYIDRIASSGMQEKSLERLVAALNKLEVLKAKELTNHGEEALYRTYAQSLDLPSRPVTIIEQHTRNIYESFRIYNLPMAYRVAFVLQAFDETYFPNLHTRIAAVMETIDSESYVDMSRLNPAEFWKVIREFTHAEHQISIEANILLRVALDEFIFHLEPEERRILERQYIINELMAELEVPGSGDFPEIVFLTDMHGAKTVFDFVAFSLGVKNYQNIQSIPELEQRLTAENIDIEKKNILFVGGSDYVDRGPKPYWGFLVNEWLRSHGKLHFIIGNHELWKDWHILGMHLRVNDALRDIAGSGMNDLERHIKTMRPFVPALDLDETKSGPLRDALNLDEEKIRKLNEVLRQVMQDFLEKAEHGEADEETIQKFADLIIDMEVNPNHALEWWAKEWGIHGNWFDVFFDQINEEAVNEAVLKNNQSLSADDLRKIESLLISEQVPETLALYKEEFLKNIRERGVLFSSLELANHPQIKANKKEILEARKHNESIRRENELRSQRGEPPLPQKKVPSAFKISTLAAAQFLQTLIAQTSALNQSAGLSLPVPDLELISETNGRRHPLVMKTALWDMQNFRLLYVDIYGNAYLHGIIPIDREQQNFKVTYKTKGGEVLTGIAAIERIQYDVREFFQDYETIPNTPQFRKELHEELGNAFAVLNEWYSDVLGLLKPQQIRLFLDSGGPSHFSNAYATSSSLSPRMFAGDKGALHVGHVDPAKLYNAKIPYWAGGMTGGLIHGDFGASPGFLALGAVISWFQRSKDGLHGVRRWGYRETPEAIAMDLKNVQAIIEHERVKEVPDVALIRNMESTAIRLERHLDNMRSGVSPHKIEDITLDKLPKDEVRKIQDYTDGVNLAKYFVERFLRENIETFEELIEKAKDQGDNRYTHYEEELLRTQQQLNNFLARKDTFRSEARQESGNPIRMALEKGWVIANHILVAFHSAFISSVLSIPEGEHSRGNILAFLFLSPETAISLLFWYMTFHTAIWWHERGHYWKAVSQRTLRSDLLEAAWNIREKGGWERFKYETKMFLLSPWGKFPGIQRVGLGYQIESPFNLAVAAEGPRVSGQMAAVMLPIAGVFITYGLLAGSEIALYIGRLAMGLGLVTLGDRFMADPGKYREFKEQERKAREGRAAASTQISAGNWIDRMGEVYRHMRENRPLMNSTTSAAWGYRNSAMGGRHTEKEYPESNISLQEGMFIPLSAKTVEDAQEMTVALQNRLKQIIDGSEGSRVMGIGLEGGLAPYITPKAGEVPELRMWRMMKQAMEDLGYIPGKDVVIALDAASSELEIAFREEFDQPDAVGQYLFWRDKNKVVMSRDELLALYVKAMEEGIPIISIEDAFSEDDKEGWQLLMKKFNPDVDYRDPRTFDRGTLFVVGDDLVTTKDESIEEAADKGWINTVLIKPNQIGTLTETTLAILTALGKGLDVVSSHRSKKPNDPMEAHVGVASNSMGLKSGGGANTERLVVYQELANILSETSNEAGVSGTPAVDSSWVDHVELTDVLTFENPTNAGIPTVGVTFKAGIPGDLRSWKFSGTTPLGTSAGTGEAIHLIDSMVPPSPVTERNSELFDPHPAKNGTFRFKKSVTLEMVHGKKDTALEKLWKQAQRYEGKGVQNAASYAKEVLGKEFLTDKASELGSLLEVDRRLLELEVQSARTRDLDVSDPIAVAQRKGVLGMNGILSTSLALARFIGWAEGDELWNVLRDQMTETMAKVVADHDGTQWESLNSDLAFDELVAELRRVAADYKKQDRPLYKELRRHLPVYEFRGDVTAAQRSESRTGSDRWIPVSTAEEIMNLPKDGLAANYPDDVFEASLNYATHGVSSNRVMGTLTFRKKSDPKYQDEFVIKIAKTSNHSGQIVAEADIARAASALNIGPAVILSSQNIVIERKFLFGYDLTSRGLMFSRHEAAMFGKKLAEMFHAMIVNNTVLYFSKTPQTHLYVLGEENGAENGIGFKINFVNWADAFYGAKEVSDPKNQYKVLEMLTDMMRSFLAKPNQNIIAWKNFEARLLELQKANYDVVQENAANYEGLTADLRKQLVSQDEGWGEFFNQVDRVYASGIVSIVELSNETIPDSEKSWRTDYLTRFSLESAGKRTVELALRHDASLDKEVAKAIAEDLYQRGYIDIHETPESLQDKLQLFLKMNGFTAPNNAKVTNRFLELMRLFPGWHLSNIAESLRNALLLLGHSGKKSENLTSAFKSYLMSQQARRIIVKEETLPNLRNRYGGGSKIDLFYEGDILPFKSYAVKGLHTNGAGEDERSQIASGLELGPHVIFTRPKPQRGTDQKPFVIVEDLLPESRNIQAVKPAEFQSARAMELLAASLALKFYTMIDPKRGKDTVLHRFDNIAGHIFIVDNDVLFIDWGFSLKLDHPAEGGVVNHLTSLLKALHGPFEKFGPLFWQKFEANIMQLAEQNGAMVEELRAAFGRSENREIPSDERVLELVQGWVALHSTPKTADHESLDDAFVAPLTDAEGAAVAVKLLNFNLEPQFADTLFVDFIHHLLVFPSIGTFWENNYVNVLRKNPERVMRGLLNQQPVTAQVPVEMGIRRVHDALRDAGYKESEYQLSERLRKVDYLENHLLTIVPKRQTNLGQPVIPAQPRKRELDEANAAFTRSVSSADLAQRSFPDLNSRSENRIAPAVLEGYQAFAGFLGQNRPYVYSRWVAVHMTNGILLPLPADLWEKIQPFITADLLQPLGQANLSKTNALQFGLDLSVFESMPNEEDLLYGIAKVLNEEPNRYVRVAVLNADDQKIQNVNTWFADEFRAYPNLQGRFQAASLPAQGRGLETGVQKIIDEVRLRAKEQGSPIPGSASEFYDRVSLSSTNTQLLKDLMVPAAWRIANDLPSDSAALQAYLIERKLALTQGLLAGAKADQLAEIKDQVISALQQFLAGEDLSRIESAFENTIMALRAIYESA